MNIEWDGVTKSKTVHDSFVKIRHELADAAKSYNWQLMLKILKTNPNLINSTRLDGTALYAPLHQAAHGGAPVEVVEQLLAMGAWRTLRNAVGERPVDIAIKNGHHHLAALLEPIYKRQIPLDTLQSIQKHFHHVILGRVESLVQKHSLRLPELEPLLEIENCQAWFPVPGMYGGFHYWLEGEGEEAKLVSDSWCRVAGGSGQRHEIKFGGSELIDEGFV
jgi:hypothetical protein